METSSVKYFLQADNLVKKYKDVCAVNDISLQVRKGECLALLGPNGAGKTTTCEMLEGLIVPDAGKITVCNHTYKQNRPAILQKIGVQLQETHLYKKYTVLETLQLFASFYKGRMEVPYILEKLKLKEKTHARLEHLSGGQKQRVYLGCSLVNNPELIFLDEPTSGLDPQARRHIWSLLKTLKSEEKSIFLTTHYMEEAHELADRIAIMDHGKIIAFGSVDELISTHCDREVLAFKVGADGEKMFREKLPWMNSVRRVSDRLEVSVENATKCTQELMLLADRNEIPLHQYAIRQSTLEDVFIKLTGRSIRDD